MVGMRENGHLVLTNQRLLWEKATAMNALGRGVIGVAASAAIKFTEVPLTDIVKAEDAKGQLMASGLAFALSNGESYRFSLSGSGHKQVRDQMVGYINGQINQERNMVK
jgi:hypothetical protein